MYYFSKTKYIEAGGIADYQKYNRWVDAADGHQAIFNGNDRIGKTDNGFYVKKDWCEQK